MAKQFIIMKKKEGNTWRHCSPQIQKQFRIIFYKEMKNDSFFLTVKKTGTNILLHTLFLFFFVVQERLCNRNNFLKEMSFQIPVIFLYGK